MRDELSTPTALWAGTMRILRNRSTTIDPHIWLTTLMVLVCTGLLPSSAAASNRTLENNRWEQLVFPGNVAAQTVGSLIGDDLPVADYDRTWKFYTFNATTNRYDAPGVNDIINAGEAFWILQLTGATVTLDLPTSIDPVPAIMSPACTSVAGCASSDLATRPDLITYSMIGSPFDESTHIADWRITAGNQADPCVAGCTLTETANAGDTSPSVYAYDPVAVRYDELTDGDSVAPWQGFWIATTGNLHNRQPQLLFPTNRSDDASLVAWANDGGDKVLRDELRASANEVEVVNHVWDGNRISVAGARNEVVAFNTIIEAADADINNVNVSLSTLTGPGGARISTRSATGNGVFNTVDRHLELFYIRYLTIRGLSRLPYNIYDERHIPSRCRRPFTVRPSGNRTRGVPVSGTDWTDRPCRDKEFPDIAVPIEFEQGFDIQADTNQSIWADITIPGNATPGQYTGTLDITADGGLSRRIPISLNVSRIRLPDVPGARTMMHVTRESIALRYLGEARPQAGTANYDQLQVLLDEHFKLAHRHRISLITGHKEIQYLDDGWTDRLSGELFTAARGYGGPGEGVGNNVFSIGTYGSWPWRNGTRQDMWSNTDAWIDWFDNQNFSTDTDTFLYLADESDDTAAIERWSQWIDSNPGQGRRLPSLATLPLPIADASTPTLDIPATALLVADRGPWETAANRVTSDPDRQLILYNGGRPASGTYAIEDDGVALRLQPWIQFKHGIDRWFYWNSTYYTNTRCYGSNSPQANTNVFRQAQTFGCDQRFDVIRGRTGSRYMNGDGVMFYPGTDTLFPNDTYGVDGPMVSLRMKHWRRGLQDHEYLLQAQQINPQATEAIVQRMVPLSLWEHGVNEPTDPTYVHADISWSIDPDDWEDARRDLAGIIGE